MSLPTHKRRTKIFEKEGRFRIQFGSPFFGDRWHYHSDNYGMIKEFTSFEEAKQEADKLEDGEGWQVIYPPVGRATKEESIWPEHSTAQEVRDFRDSRKTLYLRMVKEGAYKDPLNSILVNPPPHCLASTVKGA